MDMQTDNNVDPIIQSEYGEDRARKTKTIYDVSAFEIFWRNFLAGMARTMGGLILYFLFVFIVGMIFLQFMLPRIMPIIEKFGSFTNSLDKIPDFSKELPLSLPK